MRQENRTINPSHGDKKTRFLLSTQVFPSLTTDHYHSQRTLRPVHRTERHLNRFGHHAPRDQPLPHVTQSWTGFHLATVLTLRVLRTAPEYLSECTGAWPYHAVEVDGVRLLGPNMSFRTHHKVRGIGRHAIQWIVAIYQAPAFSTVELVS